MLDQSELGGALRVSANRAFWALTDGVAAELLAPPVSVPRLLLHPTGMAPRSLNHDVWAWHVLDALQREALRNPNDRLESLVGELEGLVRSRSWMRRAETSRTRCSESDLPVLASTPWQPNRRRHRRRSRSATTSAGCCRGRATR